MITGWGPDLSPEAIGFPVTAFLTLEIRQGSADRGGHDAVAAHLAGIPEVLEAYTITGAGDMWARVVARSNADLQRVIDLVLTEPGHRPLDDRHRAGHADPLPGASRSRGLRSPEPFGDGRRGGDHLGRHDVLVDGAVERHDADARAQSRRRPARGRRGRGRRSAARRS